jgi:hypothetical protein
MSARINSNGNPFNFGLQGAVYDRNKNIGQFAQPYRPTPPNGAMPTSIAGDWMVNRVPIQGGRPVVQARNPLAYVSPDMNRPEEMPAGQAMAGNAIPGPAGQQAAPVPAGVAPPTGLRNFSMGFADARSAAMTNNANFDEMLMRQSTAMSNTKANSILQQARNTMHLTRYGQGLGQQFGPQYFISAVGGEQVTPSAQKFLGNAVTYAKEYEPKQRVHSTITELKHTAAIIKGMEALPSKNPLLAVPRAAIVGSSRPTNFNTRYGDSRPEVPSVERNTLYPPSDTFMVQDRGAGALTDKSEWLSVVAKERSGGFYALSAGRSAPGPMLPPAPNMHRVTKLGAQQQSGQMRMWGPFGSNQ